MDVSYRTRCSVVDSIPATASGFTLIEVLITLFITAVGLLSLAALQIQGLRATHSAVMRTHAVAFTTEMAERLRATALSVASSSCSVIPCPPPTLSAAEIEDWRARIAQALPAGTGSVETAVTATDVNVDWNDHGTAQQLSLSLMP
jgi:type IV pilus assembly protein PilV